MHRQPTPESIAAAEADLGDVSPEKVQEAEAFMTRARDAERAGDQSACEQALAEAQQGERKGLRLTQGAPMSHQTEWVIRVRIPRPINARLNSSAGLGWSSRSSRACGNSDLPPLLIFNRHARAPCKMRPFAERHRETTGPLKRPAIK